MKIIITENKMYNTVYQYIDKTLTQKEINQRFDIDDYENENPNLIYFYEGPWAGEDYTHFLFSYFKTEYFKDRPSEKFNRDRSPILEVLDELAIELNTFFGDRWDEPMKDWFSTNFKLPVKTVDYYISSNLEY